MLRNLARRLRRIRLLPRRLFTELENIRQEVRALGAAEQRDRAAAQVIADQFALCERDIARFCDETVRVVRAQRETHGELVAALADLLAEQRSAARRTESLLAELREAAAAQRGEIAQLRETVEAQAPILPSWFWEPGAAESVRRVLRLLRPCRVDGVGKVRYGRPNDGGYVMMDDVGGVAAAISAGINDDVSWDLEIAARGIEVHQYDHTIAALPQTHALFRFHRQRLGPFDENGAVSLTTLLHERQAAGQHDLILKIDIEGDEWATIAATDPALLAACRQIVCEFHLLHRLAEPGFAATVEACLNRFIEAGFFVAHVHGNNCGNLINVGNIAVPDTLEVLFVNRRRYRQAAGESELFPTGLDMPNQVGRADLFLGTFTF